MQRQTAVTAYVSRKQLLLFVFALNNLRLFDLSDIKYSPFIYLYVDNSGS